MLFYQVEMQELADSPQSTVFHYNTQHSEQEEYITVIVSDQGQTGAQGISQIAETQVWGLGFRL